MENERLMYVRMKFIKWDGAFEDSNLYNIKIGFNCNSAGFLEVYDSLEKFKEDYGDEEYVIIRVEGRAVQSNIH